ncbi:SPOR domain-containing protein [Marinomonas balearica]|uniref:Sporulation related protein n=1 Tax=Marinomonas balearica TaxID=491947 RepID=A0A4R6MAW8_9GAMM|nr:SPOR domain-containing protein [Marinomonas balearica]TDO98701.1 sporulation related protein [Marinomonas balearica]
MRYSKHIVCFSVLSLVGCASLTGTSDALTNAELQNHVAAHATQINTINPKVDQLEIQQVSLQEGLASLEQELARVKMEAVKQDPKKGSMSQNAPEIKDPATMEEMSDSRIDPVIVDFKATRKMEEKLKLAKMAASSDKYYGVQLAAYASKSLAMQGWRKISRANPIDYVDTAPLIKKHTIKGKVYFQLKVGPFIERSYSVDFCNMLKQQRSQTCLITRYDGEPFLSP